RPVQQWLEALAQLCRAIAGRTRDGGASLLSGSRGGGVGFLSCRTGGAGCLSSFGGGQYPLQAPQCPGGAIGLQPAVVRYPGAVREVAGVERAVRRLDLLEEVQHADGVL